MYNSLYCISKKIWFKRKGGFGEDETGSIQPDIYVPKTIQDLNNNCDSQLNVAIDYLVQQAELANENIDDD